MIDIKTILLCTVMINIFLCVVMFAVWRTQQVYAGFGFWVLANLALVLGIMVMVLLRGIFPLIIIGIANNLIFMLAAWLRLWGLYRFFGEKRKWVSHLLGMCLVFAVLLYVFDEAMRTAVITCVLGFYLFGMARVVLSHAHGEVRALYRIAASIFMTYGLMLTVRAVMSLTAPSLTVLSSTSNANALHFLVTMLLDVGIIFVFIMMNDRRMALELQHSEEKFFKAFQTSPYAITITRPEDGRFIDVNDGFSAITEYSREEALTGSSTGLNLWADEADRLRVVADLRAGVVVAGREFPFRTKSGKAITGLFSAQILLLSMGPCILSSINDITSRKQAEEALRESEDRFRRLAENAKDMIYRMSLPDGRYEYVSPASMDVFGYSPDEFYKKPLLVRQAIHPDWTGYFNEHWEKLIHGEVPANYEYRIIDSSGHVKWLNQRNVLIRDKENRPIAIEGIVTDVTDAKQVTQAEIRLEKFVVLGRVAAGVAHELNNPLMGVLNYTQYCRENTPEADEKYAILKDIEHETRRCIEIVKNLLGVARMEDPVEGKPIEFAPEDITDRVVRLMAYRTGTEKATVLTEISGDIPKINMNRDAFQQLCLNLFTNAVDAVEATAEKEIRVGLQGDGDCVILRISDTGCGIPEDVQDKIFDPFFTTKEPGKGTGLGLATCWKIVHQQGGTIQCRSRPDLGTTMTVMLPVRRAEIL